jgi:uncharacterized phage protein gp47/JayE
VAGTVINGGVAQDANGNQWNLPDTVTIPDSGSIDVTATAATSGNITALENTITQIATPTLGWQTVTNSSDAVPGAPVESDAELRIRQAQSTALPATSPLESILAAVANITGVTRSTIYENATNITDSNGLPAHSISLIVEGGDVTQIAQTIQQKKAPGVATYGTTSIVVSDPVGLPVIINFFVLQPVQIYVSITIRPLPGYVSQYAIDLATAVSDFINSIPIGDDVFYNWLFAAAQLPGNLTYRVTSITVGISPGPTGQGDVAIAFNQAAVCSPANVVVSVS